MPTPTLPNIPEIIDGLPNICGWEAEINSVVQKDEPVFFPSTNIRLEEVTAAFAIALHMHQPTIPAGANGELISNLQYMFEHPQFGDNHNAGPFANCYSRMGDIIPELVARGCNPRVMLDYSGNLLWGLRQMGRADIIEKLQVITCDRAYKPHVEWLGTMWSHAVVPSTPIPDIKLQVQAWQQQFASIFGIEALGRVKGFSPPEMALPNHPDTLFEFIKALKQCGYRWVLVQEHTVETLEGQPITEKYLPNRLIARNGRGETTNITALIKTQGSDTKLVGQMQPYYEAKTREKQRLGGYQVPSLVTQISDGENGGVMMNEFPPAFQQAWEDMAQNHGVVGINGTEYLELIEASGCHPENYPPCQAVGQHQIWSRVDPENCTPEAVERALRDIKETQTNYHIEGASWTNSISWVKGYENVLGPMNQLSAKFHEKLDPLRGVRENITKSSEYRQALLYNLLLQTSCFRYWGQGTWTDYAREIYQRGESHIRNAF